MNDLLKYINTNHIINDKNISLSFERKLLKTFDFEENDVNISGVLNFIWKKKKYEVLVSSDSDNKIDRHIYKVFISKDDAYAFYEKIYELLLNKLGEK